ncbi:ABC transporter ATP-binding protein, partial [Rhizobium ruizarguesonis]
DIYERPANLEVAEFVGQVNIVRGKVSKAAGRTVVATVFGEVDVADDYADDTELVLALRPEAVELLPISSKEAGVPAKVLSSYYSGSLVD